MKNPHGVRKGKISYWKKHYINCEFALRIRRPVFIRPHLRLSPLNKLYAVFDNQ